MKIGKCDNDGAVSQIDRFLINRKRGKDPLVVKSSFRRRDKTQSFQKEKLHGKYQKRSQVFIADKFDNWLNKTMWYFSLIEFPGCPGWPE